MNKNKNLIIVLCFLFIYGCKSDLVLKDKTIIKGTQTWEGTVYLEGDVTVASESVLIIKPGTKILFNVINQDINLSDDELIKYGQYSPQAELIINGSIEAQGTKENPIIFTSAVKKDEIKSSQWGSLNFLGSEYNILEYCQISGAYMGIHVHSSVVNIKNCVFTNNDYGVRMKKSEDIDKPCMVNIENCNIQNNHIGISTRKAISNIVNNTIKNNEIGIWLKEEIIVKVADNNITNNKKGIFLTDTPDISISWNNIFNNQNNIYLGENQTKDFSAPNNWWGTIVPEEIEKNNFDIMWDSSLGKINYIPFLHKSR